MEAGRIPSEEPVKTSSGASLTDLMKGSKITQQVKQELNDLRDVLGRSGSVSELAVVFHHEAAASERRKPDYWRMMTQESLGSRNPWDALFTLGTEQSDDNLAAGLEEIIQLDVGQVLGVRGRDGQSIRDVILAKPTDLERLRFLKTTMNLQRIEKNPTCPAPVANAIYYLIVAVALVDHGEWISGLDDPQLDSALEWLLEEPWFCEEFRPAMMDAHRLVQNNLS